MSHGEFFDVNIVPKVAYGYAIKFTTWENDGDHYKTCTMSGIQTTQDVDFWVALASKFQSSNTQDDCYGNDSVDHDSLVELVEIVLHQHPHTSQELKDELSAMISDDANEGDLHSYLYDAMLHHPVEYDFEFCRVVEKVEVSLIQPMVVSVSSWRF